MIFQDIQSMDADKSWQSTFQVCIGLEKKNPFICLEMLRSVLLVNTTRLRKFRPQQSSSMLLTNIWFFRFSMYSTWIWSQEKKLALRELGKVQQTGLIIVIEMSFHVRKKNSSCCIRLLDVCSSFLISPFKFCLIWFTNSNFYMLETVPWSIKPLHIYMYI